MTWLRNLLLGKADKNLSGLDKVIAGGSEDEQKRVFLLLAQTAAQQPNLTSDAVKQVHKTALNIKTFQKRRLRMQFLVQKTVKRNTPLRHYSAWPSWITKFCRLLLLPCG